MSGAQYQCASPSLLMAHQRASLGAFVQSTLSFPVHMATPQMSGAVCGAGGQGATATGRDLGGPRAPPSWAASSMVDTTRKKGGKAIWCNALPLATPGRRPGPAHHRRYGPWGEQCKCSLRTVFDPEREYPEERRSALIRLDRPEV